MCPAKTAVQANHSKGYPVLRHRPRGENMKTKGLTGIGEHRALACGGRLPGTGLAALRCGFPVILPIQKPL